jgi:hypothetical protein
MSNRVTGVVSSQVWDALDRLNVCTSTNNSRTVLILLENFLVQQGLLDAEQTRTTPEDYQALCEGAQRAKQAP